MIPEKSVFIEGDGIGLEGRLALPEAPAGGVVLCHPHPLYGGDMDNPVVVRASEVCGDAGLATVRFNFRGVGASGGSPAGGVGEQDDAAAALAFLARAVGGAPLAIVGYSFGAWIAALVGARDARVQGLALIAPPLGMYDFGCIEGKRAPTLVASGTRDPYCALGDVQRFTARYPWVTPAVIDGADHFFFGKLYPLGEAVRVWARELADARDAVGRRRPG